MPNALRLLRRFDFPAPLVGSLLPLVPAAALWFVSGFALRSAAPLTVEAQEPAPPAIAAAPLSGAVLFQERGCAYCHGANAAGTEKGPSLMAVGKRLTQAQIEHQITQGGGGMPAFGEALALEEVTRLVDFLVLKKKAPHRKPATFLLAPQLAMPSGTELAVEEMER